MIDDILTFISLYETQSFVKAANILNIQQSTVSKRIARLESSVNKSLLIRNGRNFSITPFGDYIYNKFYHLPLFLRSTLNTYQEFISENLSATISVSLPFSLCHELFSPYLELFANEYPNVKLNIYYETKVLDFQVIDFAITRGNVMQPGYTSKFFRREHTYIYCSNKYAEKHGIPSSIYDLNGVKMIKLIDNDICMQQLYNLKTNQEITLNIQGNIFADNILEMKQIGVNSENYLFGCWDFLCSHDINANKIIKILPDWQISSFDFYLVKRINLREIDKLFISFISKQLGYYM